MTCTLNSLFTINCSIYILFCCIEVENIHLRTRLKHSLRNKSGVNKLNQCLAECNHLFLQVGLIQMIKHVACQKLYHASYDLGFYTVTYASCNVCRRLGPSKMR